tara:strand:- start:11205 stop:11384 length:180 start_codon:yes stop_codon:yes gene_type:complete
MSFTEAEFLMYEKPMSIITNIREEIRRIKLVRPTFWIRFIRIRLKLGKNFLNLILYIHI